MFGFYHLIYHNYSYTKTFENDIIVSSFVSKGIGQDTEYINPHLKHGLEKPVVNKQILIQIDKIAKKASIFS